MIVAGQYDMMIEYSHFSNSINIVLHERAKKTLRIFDSWCLSLRSPNHPNKLHDIFILNINLQFIQKKIKGQYNDNHRFTLTLRGQFLHKYFLEGHSIEEFAEVFFVPDNYWYRGKWMRIYIHLNRLENSFQNQLIED